MVKIYRFWHILAIALQHPVILWKRKINNKRIKLYWQSPICHWYVVKLFCLPFLLSDKLFFKIYCQKFLWYAIFCTHTSVNALSVTGTSPANSGVVFHRLLALSTHWSLSLLPGRLLVSTRAWWLKSTLNFNYKQNHSLKVYIERAHTHLVELLWAEGVCIYYNKGNDR